MQRASAWGAIVAMVAGASFASLAAGCGSAESSEPTASMGAALTGEQGGTEDAGDAAANPADGVGIAAPDLGDRAPGQPSPWDHLDRLDETPAITPAAVAPAH